MTVAYSRLNLARYAVLGVLFLIFVRLLKDFKHRTETSPTSSWPRWKLSYFTSSSLEPSTQRVWNTFLPEGPELDTYCRHYRFKPFPDRVRRRKIYDLDFINSEIEWLEIHMGEMTEVDYFVIAESPTTFSGLLKPLYVEENWERFAPFHHKMLLHSLNTTNPSGKKWGNPWEFEHFNRNALFDQIFPHLRGEQKAWPGDIILVGEVDELVRPEVLSMLRNCDFPKRTRLYTTPYYYSFQWIATGEGRGSWNHPDVTYFDGFKDTVLPQELRDGGSDIEIWNSGWRCSFCFDKLEDVVTKIESYNHQGTNMKEILDPRHILERVRNGEDLFLRTPADIQHRYENNVDIPGYLLRNCDKYPFALDRDAEDGNFVDTYDVIGE